MLIAGHLTVPVLPSGEGDPSYRRVDRRRRALRRRPVLSPPSADHLLELHDFHVGARGWPAPERIDL